MKTKQIIKIFLIVILFSKCSKHNNNNNTCINRIVNDTTRLITYHDTCNNVYEMRDSLNRIKIKGTLDSLGFFYGKKYIYWKSGKLKRIIPLWKGKESGGITKYFNQDGQLRQESLIVNNFGRIFSYRVSNFDSLNRRNDYANCVKMSFNDSLYHVGDTVKIKFKINKQYRYHIKLSLLPSEYFNIDRSTKFNHIKSKKNTDSLEYSFVISDTTKNYISGGLYDYAYDSLHREIGNYLYFIEYFKIEK